MYAVAGRGAATATSGDAIAQLWNPSGGEAISVWSYTAYNVSGVNILGELVRTTARGTAGSTTTPDLDNHFGQRATPSSAPVLDLSNFSTEPTAASPRLIRNNGNPAAGSPLGWDLPVPITVPPNSGLAHLITSNLTVNADSTFVWTPGSTGMGDAFYCGAQPDALGAAEAAWTTLWNPHASITLYVFYITFCNRSTAATEFSAQLVRSTARGTQSATTTPDADNHVEQRAAPVSGAVIDSGYTAEPTMDASVLYQWDFNERSPGGGIIWQVPTDDENGIDTMDGIAVPPGTGLTIRASAAAVSTSKEVTFGWFE